MTSKLRSGSPEKQFQLLQFADSCFPVGGFAFSSGLESWVKLGHLSQPGSFGNYLSGYMQQVIHADLGFLNSFLSTNTEFEVAEWVQLASYWQAFNPSSVFRRASLMLGNNWLRAVQAIHPGPNWKVMEDAISDFSCLSHFLSIYTFAMKEMGFRKSDARYLYVYMALRDQCSAGVRLGAIGPMQAQKLLSDIWPKARDAIGSAPRSFKMAVKRAPMLDIGQLCQPRLYSRLFQS